MANERLDICDFYSQTNYKTDRILTKNWSNSDKNWSNSDLLVIYQLEFSDTSKNIEILELPRGAMELVVWTAKTNFNFSFLEFLVHY